MSRRVFQFPKFGRVARPSMPSVFSCIMPWKGGHKPMFLWSAWFCRKHLLIDLHLPPAERVASQYLLCAAARRPQGKKTDMQQRFLVVICADIWATQTIHSASLAPDVGSFFKCYHFNFVTISASNLGPQKCWGIGHSPRLQDILGFPHLSEWVPSLFWVNTQKTSGCFWDQLRKSRHQYVYLHRWPRKELL